MRYALGREALQTDSVLAKNVVRASAATEAVTGIVLIVDPSLVVRLLWAAPLPAGGPPLGHLTGFGLLALGIACWPQRIGPSGAAVRGLLLYNALATIFFLYLAIRGEFVGVLLWPALIVHAIFTALLLRVFMYGHKTGAL